MTVSDERKPTLAELRASAETTSHKEGQVAVSATPPAWLPDLEGQRQDLFDALFAMIDEDKAWCEAFIEQAQSNPDTLIKRCVISLEKTDWTLHPATKYYKEHCEAHKEACLQHIAFLALVISDIRVLQSLRASPSLDIAAQLVILPPNRADIGISWAMRSLAQASEHLAAVRMLKNKDRYLSDRGKGGQTKAQTLRNDELYSLLRPMVKILLQSESHRKRSRADTELIERYVMSIIELWKCWPFFNFDRNELTASVTTILEELNVVEERKKSLFERRRRTPMSRPQQFSRSTELEARQSEAWQGGLATALVHILETSFGRRLDETDEEKIAVASPEQLGIWLCRTRKANSLKDVLA